MATKSKVTKESAPKAAKATAVPAPETKSVAKAKKAAVPLKKAEPVAVPKVVKSAVKAKPQPVEVATAPKKKAAAVPAVTPQPAPAAPAPKKKAAGVPVEKPKPAVVAPVAKKKAAAVPAAPVAPAEKPKKAPAPKSKPAVEPEAPQVIPVVQAAPAEKQEQKWQEIRLILEKLKDETLREIRKSVKNGTEAVAAIEPGGDIYDQASSERDRELGLLLGDREREKIHSIDEALLRIDDGDYGICEECEEDIPLGRLKAMPFTRHCVKCKSDLEKLQAQTKRVEEERAYREIPLGAEEEES